MVGGETVRCSFALAPDAGKVASVVSFIRCSEPTVSPHPQYRHFDFEAAVFHFMQASCMFE